MVEKQLRRARRELERREQDIGLQRAVARGDGGGPDDRIEVERKLRRLEEEQAMLLRRIDQLVRTLAEIEANEIA